MILAKLNIFIDNIEFNIHNKISSYKQNSIFKFSEYSVIQISEATGKLVGYNFYMTAIYMENFNKTNKKL